MKRGLILMALEVFYLSELYWGVASPTLWLQVIWCIGVCMIVLAAMIGLPRSVLLAAGVLIVCGHNLLDPITNSGPMTPTSPSGHAAPARRHRAPFGLVAKTTYPVLPWIGVIALGYAIGPWFLPGVAIGTRERRFAVVGRGDAGHLCAAASGERLREKPWFVVDDSALRTAMSFFALTKVSALAAVPSPYVGDRSAIVRHVGTHGRRPVVSALAVFGGAPLFFYLLHLTILRLLYHGAFAIWGQTQGTLFAVSDYAWVLVWYAGLIGAPLLPDGWFSRLKASRRDIVWLKYL